MEKKTILEKLFKIQQSVKPIVKNADGFKGKYAPLSVVWEAVRPAMERERLVWFSESAIREIGGDMVQSGISLKIIIADVDSGETLVSEYPIFSANPQDVGKMETYFRRYALMRMLGVVVTGDDDDADSVARKALPHPVTSFD